MAALKKISLYLLIMMGTPCWGFTICSDLFSVPIHHGVVLNDEKSFLGGGIEGQVMLLSKKGEITVEKIYNSELLVSKETLSVKDFLRTPRNRKYLPRSLQNRIALEFFREAKIPGFEVIRVYPWRKT